MDLEHWLSRTKELIGQFSTITFQHIFRDFNTVEDDLSKKAIGTGFRNIFWQEFIDSSLIDSGSLII